MKTQSYAPLKPKRSLSQRFSASIRAFRDEPAPTPAASASLLAPLQRLIPQHRDDPLEQALELLRNPLVQRGIQMAGLADLAMPNDPRGEAGAVGALAGSLVPIMALRKTFEDLRDLRPIWPVVLPLLALFGYRTYTNERRRILRTRSTGAAASQPYNTGQHD